MSALLKNPEIEFAKEDLAAGSMRMRVTYKAEAGHRFPVVYKEWGDNTVTRLELTEEQGRWLTDVLSRMFRA